MFSVYKVTGQHTSYVYYGYTNADPKEEFAVQMSRIERPGGATQFLIENNNDKNVTLTVVANTDDELQAFIKRNELRANDTRSIAGPSMYPSGVWQRIAKTRQVEHWKKINAQRTAPTAMDAYRKHGAFGFDLIQRLVRDYTKEQIVGHLEAMTPLQFCYRYDVDTVAETVL